MSKKRKKPEVITVDDSEDETEQALRKPVLTFKASSKPAAKPQVCLCWLLSKPHSKSTNHHLQSALLVLVLAIKQATQQVRGP